MNRTVPPDWDPTSTAVLGDQDAAYDDMRQRCPVAYSDPLGWSLFRHADVIRVLEDSAAFSNVVSARCSVPNGMDPPEHTAYRRALEPYFGAEALQGFEPVCRRIASDLYGALPLGVEFDFIDAFSIPFAVRCQCAFLGWSDDLAEPLRQWARKNHAAILANDRSALAALGLEFESYVARVLEERRGVGAPPDDVTTRLIHAEVGAQRLTAAELSSIFRNWTVGEVGSLTAAVGILAQHLATNPVLQDSIRREPARLPNAVEEILRTSGPLLFNRRRATRDITVGGRNIAAGDRVSVMWTSANRDERVFDDPATVRLDRAQDGNLLWGHGIHICPGAPLARLEMRIALEVVLDGQIERGETPPVPAVFPTNGWAVLPLKLLASARDES